MTDYQIIAIDEAEKVAFQAVCYVLGNETLRDRMMALTGITAEDFAQRITEHDFLCAVLEFFVQYEPDLITFAEETDLSPKTVMACWRALGGQFYE